MNMGRKSLSVTSSSRAFLTFSASSNASFSTWKLKFRRLPSSKRRKLSSSKRRMRRAHLPVGKHFIYHLFCILWIITNQYIVENWTSLHLHKIIQFASQIKLSQISKLISMIVRTTCQTSMPTYLIGLSTYRSGSSSNSGEKTISFKFLLQILQLKGSCLEQIYRNIKIHCGVPGLSI